MEIYHEAGSEMVLILVLPRPEEGALFSKVYFPESSNIDVQPS